MACRWTMPLTLAALAAGVGSAWAQGAFPAPLPGQGATVSPPSAPPLSGAAPAPASECTKDFIPLREDAEKKGKLIKEAGERHAAPEEACKLIKNYSVAEVKMIKYVESNFAKCGIPAQVADQLRAGHKNTEGLEQRVCGVAEQQMRVFRQKSTTSVIPPSNGGGNRRVAKSSSGACDGSAGLALT